MTFVALVHFACLDCTACFEATNSLSRLKFDGECKIGWGIRIWCRKLVLSTSKRRKTSVFAQFWILVDFCSAAIKSHSAQFCRFFVKSVFASLLMVLTPENPLDSAYVWLPERVALFSTFLQSFDECGYFSSQRPMDACGWNRLRISCARYILGINVLRRFAVLKTKFGHQIRIPHTNLHSPINF